MRRILRWMALVLAISGAATVIDETTASADTVCQQTSPVTGQCLIWVQAPSGPSAQPSSPPTDTGAASACYWDGSKQGITNPPPGPVPCTKNGAYWSNSYHCYISIERPQPPANDPIWQAHQPGDGAVYNCDQPQTGLLITIWAQNPPPGSGAGPTPRDVANLAITQMNLRAIDIGITPEPGANSVGLVGMPVWLWAANPDGHTVGPMNASATSGGITVTATARLLTVTWDMGDGHTVTCAGAGTPYRASDGQSKSPDCGYVYARSSSYQQNGMYKVTATSDWVITWVGAGQTGTIRLNRLTRSAQIAVGEAQVLVQ